MDGNEERISVFINSLERESDPFLEELEQKARRDQIPVIRHEMISFLQLMVKISKPARILEVGTAVGFSALVMAKVMPKDCILTSIEHDPDRIKEAAENIRQDPCGSRIRLIEGEAQDILPTLEGPYDLIFMDAAKGQYIHFLPHVLDLLAPGGLLITDNVLRGGDILESHYALERRNRTIHKRMREYLEELKTSPLLDTSIIPLADGVALCRKKEGDFGIS